MRTSNIKQKYIDEYNSARTSAIKFLERGDCIRGSAFAKYAATVAWRFPILTKYSDSELELSLINAFKSVIKWSPLAYNPKGHVLFYATTLVDRGALTQQYIMGLKDAGYRIVLLISSREATLQGKNLLAKIESTEGIDLIYAEGHNLYKKLECFHDALKKYNFQSIYLHCDPTDILGFLFGALNIGLPRWYIVHCDHSFWLGLHAADHFIEFRPFGQILSYERRRIPMQKIERVAFYPIIENIPFRGFPFERKKKCIALSGANLHKYLVDPELSIFRAITLLIRENENLNFCIAGWGDTKPLLLRLKEMEIQTRVHFLGYRDDFAELVKASDILIESFPLRGCLTALYAVNNGVCTLGIGNNNTPSQSIEKDLEISGYESPRDIEGFISEGRCLVADPFKRKEKAAKFLTAAWTKDRFEKEFAISFRGKGYSNNDQMEHTLQLDDECWFRQCSSRPSAEYDLMSEKAQILFRYLNIKDRINLLKRIIILSNNDRGRSIDRTLLRIVANQNEFLSGAAKKLSNKTNKFVKYIK